LGKDPNRVREAMKIFDREGIITFSKEEVEQARNDFASVSIDQESTIDTIRTVYKETGYVLDPHSAVGVAAARRLSKQFSDGPVVSLATAHPCKFPEAVRKATGRDPEAPERIRNLENLPQRFTEMDPSESAVKNFLAENALP